MQVSRSGRRGWCQKTSSIRGSREREATILQFAVLLIRASVDYITNRAFSVYQKTPNKNKNLQISSALRHVHLREHDWVSAQHVVAEQTTLH
jgi:hypothetical protein